MIQLYFFMIYYMLWCTLSHIWLFVTLWTVGHQAPLAMEFSRQEYLSGLPFPSPGYLPNPRIKPTAPVSPALAGRFFTTAPLEKPYDSMDVGSLISGSPAFSKSCLYIWKFLVHVLLKPSLKDFEHYFASMWNGHNCVVVWSFLGIPLLRDWNENWPFPVLWPLLFSKFAGILSAALSQHHFLGLEIAQLEFHHLH